MPDPNSPSDGTEVFRSSGSFMDTSEPGSSLGNTTERAERADDRLPALDPGRMRRFNRPASLTPRLLSTLAREVLPAVNLEQCEVASPGIEPCITEDTVTEIACLSMGTRERATAGRVEELRDEGLDVDTLCLELLSPAARQLGMMWEQDRVSFIDVTLGLSQLQEVFTELCHQHGTGPAMPGSRHSVLLMATRGEQHSFGMRMVAEYFRWDGWDVRDALPKRQDDMRDLVRHTWFDTVGFSLAAEQHLDVLEADIKAVRRHSCNPVMTVLVGGPLFSETPSLAGRVGADATASDARLAPAMARQQVAQAAQAG